MPNKTSMPILLQYNGSLHEKGFFMKNLFRSLSTVLFFALASLTTATQYSYSSPITCKCNFDDFLKAIRCCCICLQCTADSSLSMFDKLDRIQPTLTKLSQKQQHAFIALINLCNNPNFPCPPAEITTLQQLGFLDEDGILTLEPTDKAAILSLLANPPISRSNLFEPSELDSNDYTLKEDISTNTIYRAALPELLTDPETKKLLLNFMNIFNSKKSTLSLNELTELEALGLLEKNQRPWYYLSCMSGKQSPTHFINLDSSRIKTLTSAIKITGYDEHGTITDIALNDEVMTE